MASREKAYAVSAEQAVQDCGLSQQGLVTIVEASYDGIYVTDGDANTILVNKSYEKISGLLRGDVLGHNMRDLVADGTISRSGTLAALEKGEPVTIEQVFQTGKRVLVTSTPIFDANSKIDMVLTNVRDITELHTLKEKLEASAQANLLHARELEYLRGQIGASQNLVAEDPAMREVLRLSTRVAGLNATVLMVGENGTGKRALAHYIVNKSHRRKERYITINCATNFESLEKEIFGCAPGVDPTAPEGKAGWLELADGGTVLLDEIGELPMELQMRISQFLTNRRLERVGAGTTVSADVRVLASTSRSLMELVEQHKFCKDLFYQLDVFPIHVPPLRERRADILPIVDELVPILNKKYRQKKRFSNSARQALRDYSWPGNLRELHNMVERVMIMCPSSEVGVGDLPFSADTDKCDTLNLSAPIDLRGKVEELELRYINEAYQKFGNVRDAARSLKMDPSTFVRKRNKLKGERCCKNDT